jgi:Regulator of chromosome condensation (RCC1) repeat
MLADSKLALALSAGLVALLVGCGGGGGGGSNNSPDPGNAGTVGGPVTPTDAEDNTPTTPYERRISLNKGSFDLYRLLVNKDGSVLVLGGVAQSQMPTTPIPGTAAAKIDGLPPIASVWVPYFGSRTIALSRTGEIWAWGDNNNREFGPETAPSTQPTPKLMSAWGTAKDVVTCLDLDVALILKADGSLRYSPGIRPDVGSSTLGTVSGLTKVARIAPGMAQLTASTCQFVAVTESGSAQSIIVQGSFENNQRRYTAKVTPILGLPALVDIHCSRSHCLAQGQDNTAWAWGANDHGQLGDGTTIGRTIPVQVQGLNADACKRLIATERGSMAVTNAGGLVLWGILPQSLYDRLYAADPLDPWLESGFHVPYQFYADGADIVDVFTDLWGDAGSYQMANGEVLNWGSNTNGELGDGTKDSNVNATLDTSVKALGINLN